MIRASKILLVLFVIFITFIVGLTIAGLVLEDRITALSLEQINKKLKVKVKINKTRVSLLSGFPKASVKLRGVEILEGSLDTPAEFEPGLLSLQEVDLRISLWGIIKREYRIDELILRNGWLNFYFDNSGNGNFEIFQTNSEEKEGWLLNLDEFKLDNINLSYIDIRTGWIFKGFIEKANINGELANDQMVLGILAKGAVGTLKQGDFFYIRNQRVSVTTDFFIAPNLVRIDDGQATVGSTNLLFSGKYGRERGDRVQLKVNGFNLGVETLVSFLSQYNYTIPPHTKTQGNINFDLDLIGFTKTEKPYNIDLSFNSENLKVFIPEKPELTLSNLKGSFTNGLAGISESSEIQINSIKVFSGKSFFEGYIKIKNINKPLYHAKIKHNIFVEDALSWGADLPIVTGNLKGDIEALGIIEDSKTITINSFENSKFISTIDFSDFEFKQVGRIPELTRISGVMKIFNQDITDAKIKGIIHNSNFEADIQSKNALAILFGKRKATVSANVTIDSLNTQWLFTEAKEDAQSASGFSIWDRIESISGDVFIDEMVHNSFVSKPMSANIYLKSNQLFCNSFLSRSCGGIFTGRFSSHTQGMNYYILSADVDIEDVDIQRLFESFSNFDQQTIKSDNISGTLEGSLLFTTPIVDGNVIQNEFDANADLIITNGRLTNVKQLESLSNFIELDELKDIKFKTLENSIRVYNQQVTIPQMEIESSAINLSLSGKHLFNGEYDYRFKLLLSDLLYSKMLNKKSVNESFGEVEEDERDMTKLYLKLVGDNNDFKVSYDGITARDAFKESLRQERQSVKNILLDEFKFLRRDKAKSDTLSFKLNDSIKSLKVDTLKNGQKIQGPKYKIEWDDE